MGLASKAAPKIMRLSWFRQSCSWDSNLVDMWKYVVAAAAVALGAAVVAREESG